MNREMELKKDPYLMRILFCAYRRARTANEISRALRIPLAETYRKLGVLRKHGLIRVDSEMVAPKGNVMRYFKAEINDLYMDIDIGGARIRLNSVFDAVRCP